jgi:GT2 family glycosyltransferase
MKSYYNCNLFENNNFLIYENFTVEQKELLLKNYEEHNNKAHFNSILVKYACYFEKDKTWDKNKPTIIICVKDNIQLLEKTLENLNFFNVKNICNIFIVDDRSKLSLKNITRNNFCSYLRIDNDKGFNFSMLNNIAAFLCYKLGGNEIILWNSDLWCANEENLIKFIQRHRENNSTLSGSKLLYPPKNLSLYQNDDSENIKIYFPSMSGKWRETIQFGGTVWINGNPHHAYRFKDKHNNLVNCDKGETSITGAFQMINLNDFIELGGLNPSLSKNYQDNDFCLKLLENKKLIFYFGKDIHFYHDESITLLAEGKNDKQLFSDSVLFYKIWKEKINNLVY